MTAVQGFGDKIAFIWSGSDLPHGGFKAHAYERVILPFTEPRRLECVLTPTKDAVVKRSESLRGTVDAIDATVRRDAERSFYHVSPLDLSTILAGPSHVAPEPRRGR